MNRLTVSAKIGAYVVICVEGIDKSEKLSSGGYVIYGDFDVKDIPLSLERIIPDGWFLLGLGHDHEDSICSEVKYVTMNKMEYTIGRI